MWTFWVHSFITHSRALWKSLHVNMCRWIELNLVGFEIRFFLRFIQIMCWLETKRSEQKAPSKVKVNLFSGRCAFSSDLISCKASACSIEIETEIHIPSFNWSHITAARSTKLSARKRNERDAKKLILIWIFISFLPHIYSFQFCTTCARREKKKAKRKKSHWAAINKNVKKLCEILFKRNSAYVTFELSISNREIKIHEISFIDEESVKKKRKRLTANYVIEIMCFRGHRHHFFVELLKMCLMDFDAPLREWKKRKADQICSHVSDKIESRQPDRRLPIREAHYCISRFRFHPRQFENKFKVLQLHSITFKFKFHFAPQICSDRLTLFLRSLFFP